MILFADCGNTAVKLAFGSDRIRVLPNARELAAWWAGRHADELVLLPGATRSATTVRTWWPGRVRVVGEDIALPERGQYPGMGMDRIVAGLAVPAQSIVLDAGTATTLTAWDAAGRCAGGLILPGPHAMIAGLVSSAPALPAPDPMDGSALAAQLDTRGAIAAAVGIGHPAMVAACLERLQRETGTLRVVATGGGAPELARCGIIKDVQPWLVLDGMMSLVR